MSKLKCVKCKDRFPSNEMIETNIGFFCCYDHVTQYIRMKKDQKRIKNKKAKSHSPPKKNKKNKNPKYLAWVKTLPCCICGVPQCGDFHHAIGMKLGGMAMKAPDHMTMPLCREHHTEMHNKPELWYLQNGFILKTKKRARELGIKYE